MFSTVDHSVVSSTLQPLEVTFDDLTLPLPWQELGIEVLQDRHRVFDELWTLLTGDGDDERWDEDWVTGTEIRWLGLEACVVHDDSNCWGVGVGVGEGCRYRESCYWDVKVYNNNSVDVCLVWCWFVKCGADLSVFGVLWCWFVNVVLTYLCLVCCDADL